MLDFVAELSKYAVRNVCRVLCNKVNSNTLGSYKLNHLLNLLNEYAWHIREEEMRLIEEENDYRLLLISHLRKFLKQLCHHPKKEDCIELGIVHKGCGIQNIYHTSSVYVMANPVHNVKVRFSEELISALILNWKNSSNDCAQ